MTDEEAIQKTISTFSDETTRRNLTGVIATFVPDATWEVSGFEEIGTLRFNGVAEMIPAMEKMVIGYEYIVQMNAPAIITVDRDRATARSVMREAMKPTTGNECFDILGTYDDQLVRTPEGWRFNHRTFTKIGFVRIPISPNRKLF